MAAKSAGWKLRKLALDEPIAGVRSMVGFAFTSKAGFVSAAGAAISAKSSGEQEISFASAAAVATRGRVCATAEVNQRLRAKQATRTRANGFRSTINGELPSLKYFGYFLFLCEEGTAKRPRHL